MRSATLPLAMPSRVRPMPRRSRRTPLLPTVLCLHPSFRPCSRISDGYEEHEVSGQRACEAMKCRKTGRWSGTRLQRPGKHRIRSRAGPDSESDMQPDEQTPRQTSACRGVPKPSAPENICRSGFLFRPATSRFRRSSRRYDTSAPALRVGLALPDFRAGSKRRCSGFRLPCLPSESSDEPPPFHQAFSQGYEQGRQAGPAGFLCRF